MHINLWAARPLEAQQADLRVGRVRCSVHLGASIRLVTSVTPGRSGVVAAQTVNNRVATEA